MIGVGTELKRMLHRMGIDPTPTCNCEAYRIIMDEEGPDWCLENMEVILKWLNDEAKARGMPFSRLGASALVRLAVWRARRKLLILEA